MAKLPHSAATKLSTVAFVQHRPVNAAFLNDLPPQAALTAAHTSMNINSGLDLVNTSESSDLVYS